MFDKIVLELPYGINTIDNQCETLSLYKFQKPFLIV